MLNCVIDQLDGSESQAGDECNLRTPKVSNSRAAFLSFCEQIRQEGERQRADQQQWKEQALADKANLSSQQPKQQYQPQKSPLIFKLGR